MCSEKKPNNLQSYILTLPWEVVASPHHLFFLMDLPLRKPNV